MRLVLPEVVQKNLSDYPLMVDLSVSWVAKIASQPAAAWWAAGYEAVHPQLLQAIEWQHMNGKAPDGIYQKLWLLLLERYRHAPSHHHDEGWYPLLQRVEPLELRTTTSGLPIRSTAGWIEMRRPLMPDSSQPAHPDDALVGELANPHGDAVHRASPRYACSLAPMGLSDGTHDPLARRPRTA